MNATTIQPPANTSSSTTIPLFVASFVVLCIVFLTDSQPQAAELEWELVSDEQDIELYGATQKIDGQLPFKAITEIQAPYQQIVMALMDYEQKPSWAPKLLSTKFHFQNEANQFAYSEYYEAPWPFFDREFLLDGRIEFRDNSVVFEASNLPQTSLAADNHVLVDIAILRLEITPVSQDSSQVTFTFSGNMGGWIPNFVKNIIQRKWPILFLQALENHLVNEEVKETALYEKLPKRDLTIPHS